MNITIAGHRAQKERRAYVRNRPAADHEGAAYCECGLFSPVLPSAVDRTRWHRQHLADVIAGKAKLL